MQDLTLKSVRKASVVYINGSKFMLQIQHFFLAVINIKKNKIRKIRLNFSEIKVSMTASAFIV